MEHNEQIAEQTAALKAQVAELAAALAAQQAKNATLVNDAEERIQREAGIKADELLAQYAAVQADKIERNKPRVVTRPASYAEYASASLSDRVKMLDLYGGEQLVSELLAKKKREDAVFREQELDKLRAKHSKHI